MADVEIGVQVVCTETYYSLLIPLRCLRPEKKVLRGSEGTFKYLRLTIHPRLWDFVGSGFTFINTTAPAPPAGLRWVGDSDPRVGVGFTGYGKCVPVPVRRRREREGGKKWVKQRVDKELSQ